MKNEFSPRWNSNPRLMHSRQAFFPLDYKRNISGGCLCGKIISSCFNISLGVVRSIVLYREALVVKRKDACRECMSLVSIPTEGKIHFSQFTSFIKWYVKSCFVKLI